MASGNWGECKTCRSFEIEPEAAANDSTMGLCLAHEHEAHKLRVSGASGCGLFEIGTPAHLKGASQLPSGDAGLN